MAYQQKTTQNDGSVAAFLAAIEPEVRRTDAHTLHEMMTRVTGYAARMWGGAHVGFGAYHYKYASGHEGDWFATGFSPRKQNMSIHILPNLDKYTDHLGALGPHKTGRSCLYVTRLARIDMAVLEDLVIQAMADMKRLYTVQ